MPANRDKRELARDMEQRVLTGPGLAPPELRAQAFANRDLPQALASLLDKVAKRSFQVTDDDFAAALATGFTEDQLFELVICAAVGESGRLYQAGLSALAEVTG